MTQERRDRDRDDDTARREAADSRDNDRSDGGGPASSAPPGGGTPFWLNPRFLLATVTLVAAAVVIRSIITDPPGDNGNGSAIVPVTTLPGQTTIPQSTTTMPSGVPQGLGDFGDTVGLTPDELDDLIGKMIPYDGTWYPSPGLDKPEDEAPGMERVGWFTASVPEPIDLTGGAGLTFPETLPPGDLVGVSIDIVDDALDMDWWSPGYQIAFGIACESTPEQAGPDGFGGEWDRLSVLTATTFNEYLLGEGFTPTEGGFAFVSGDIVVIGAPVDICDGLPAAAAVTVFHRYTELGAQPSTQDPAAYQWSLIGDFDPTDTATGFVFRR